MSSEDIEDECLLKHVFSSSRDDLLVLPEKDAVYLDYAASPLVSRSLLQDVFQELSSVCIRNPHSMNGQDNFITGARQLTLRHFGVTEKEYQVVFTSGATSGLKLVGEIFPWSRDSIFLYPTNSHNSLMAMRSFASSFQSIPSHTLYNHNADALDKSALDIYKSFSSSTRVKIDKEHNVIDKGDENTYSLLGLAGECNFSGSKVNFSLLQRLLNQLNTQEKTFLWLLDAAKLASSTDINLLQSCGDFLPHFVVCSFYKLFGYPTGLGALLVRQDIAHLLQKSYFGGGAIAAGSVLSPWLVPREQSSALHYEDGTVNFQAIASLKHGFSFLRKLGGMLRIEQYTHKLWKLLVQKLKELVHCTGLPVCVFYHPPDFLSYSTAQQGPVIALNVQYKDGSLIGYSKVQGEAKKWGIYLRTGCVCNLGACHEALGMSEEDIKRNHSKGKVCSGQNEDALDIIENQHTGICRLSLGYGSSLRDINHFILFLRSTFLDKLPLYLSLKSLALSSKEDGRNVIPVDQLFFQKEVYNFPRSPNISLELLSSTSSSLSLHAIYIYPIKSCAGIRVDAWPVTPSGLLFDRCLAIMNTDSHTIITQKQCPRLALLYPSIDYDDIEDKWIIRLYSNEQGSLELVLQEGCNLSARNKQEIDEDSKISLRIRVCGRCNDTAYLSNNDNNEEEAISQWITSYINKGLSTEKQKYKYTIIRSLGDSKQIKEGGSRKKGEVSSFVNTAQYLLLSTSSIQSLVQMIKGLYEQEIDENNAFDTDHIYVENFRPNLIVHPFSSQILNGHNHHTEDSLQSLTLTTTCLSSSTNISEISVKNNSLTLQSTGPCARCMMVNINHTKGQLDNNIVYDVLQSYRKQNGEEVWFGQFLAYHSEESDRISLMNESLFSESIWLLPRLYVGTEVIAK